MNAFAHSVDEFIGEVDLIQVLKLMIELCRLDSDMRRTKFHIVGREACGIRTSHFFLANLIFNLLVFSSKGAGEAKEIRIDCDADDKEVRITFSGITNPMIDEFPTRKEEWLAKALSGQTTFNTAAGEINVVLPVQLNASPIQGLVFEP
jgi:hypothetical protein